MHNIVFAFKLLFLYEYVNLVQFECDQIPVLDELMDTIERLSQWLSGTQLSKNRVNLLQATEVHTVHVLDT